MSPRFYCEDIEIPLRSVRGCERLGEPSRFELELLSAEPLAVEGLLGKPAAVVLWSAFGERVAHGVVTRIERIATAQAAAPRRYRATVESTVALSRLRRQTRVFQHLSVPEILAEVVKAVGVQGKQFETRLFESHPARAYVTQYAESDADFVRRLCEDEGLTFRFEARAGFDALLVEDDSKSAADAAEAEIPLVDATRANPAGPAATSFEWRRRRAPSKVTVRDYDPARPALALEGVSEAGLATEKGVEVYRAPGGFKSASDGQTRADKLLQRLRAQAVLCTFDSTAITLAPGLSLRLTPVAEGVCAVPPPERLFVIGVDYTWQASGAASSRVTAVPGDIAYRLPAIAPRPKISGIHTATVTGAAGEEIHTDAGGHATVRFHWDRSGPTDHKSSLPVRTMQSNMPGPMLVPRVGWEVAVAFDDGDPDRPYVLGRTYNHKQPPPYPLPANKTITSMATVSSPGGGRKNSIHLDDAAGRQHMGWDAGFHKTTTVANDMSTQTAGFEINAITGNQTRKVGADETVSIANAMETQVGSQSATVGGSQTLTLKAAGFTTVGSETVVVGGAVIEQVGNPVDGAAAFAQAGVLAGVSEIPGVGPYLTKAYGAGKAAYEGYKHGGIDGMMTALKTEAITTAAEQVPAGDALVAGAEALGIMPGSNPAKKAGGAAAAGGGGAGAGAAAAGAAAAAPGHRKTIVNGVMAEAIGGACAAVTPGAIKWTSVGAASFAIGGSHSTRAVKISRLTGGLSSDTAASVSLKAAKAIGRTVTGALKTTVAGSLKSDAGGAHHVKVGGNLTIDVAGSAKLDGGAVVFVVGSSIVAAHGGGVLLKATKVTINGKAVQSGKATAQ